MPADPALFRQQVALSSDAPLCDVLQDKLDVASFVRRLVGPLLRAPAADSLVLGLYGPWGYGKSTALNFLESELWKAALPESRRRDPASDGDQTGAVPAPVIVRFTPWLYADVESLLASFFETLATTLNEKLPDTKARTQLAANLRGIGQFIAPVAKLGAHLFLGPGAVVAGAVIDAASGVSRGAAEVVTGGEVSYRKQKDEAARILRDLGCGTEPRRVVVLIDDLDRAAPSEMLAMLKLVKLVGDLPNVSYVIALDKDRVSRALSETLKTGAGSDYLEKIIQVGVSLPPFPRDRLTKLAVEQARDVARLAGLDFTTFEISWSEWDGLRESGYVDILGRAVRTPRDVTRLLNAFRFAALSSDARADIHPVDLLLLCALQVRFPTVYQVVRENRRFLLHEEWSDVIARAGRRTDSSDVARTQRNARLTDLLKNAGEVDADTADAKQLAASTSTERTLRGGSPSLAMDILLELFPYCVEPEANEDQRPRLRHEARIASPHHFDGYFRLDPTPGVLKRVEIEMVLDKLSVETFNDDDADTMAAMGEKLSGELRASLRQGLSDAARELVPARAIAMLRSLPVLARARVERFLGGAGESTFPLESIETLLIRSASAARLTSDPTIRAETINKVLQVLDALPDDESAELANNVSFQPPRSLDLSEPEVRRIAAAGLPRAQLAVFGKFAEPGAVREDGAQFSHDLWRWRRLADISGAVAVDQHYKPIREFVHCLLEREPAVVAEIIALAAGWGGEPYAPRLDMHFPWERHKTLARIIDPAEVLQIADAVIERGDLQSTTWPHLLDEFVEPERGVQSQLFQSVQPPADKFNLDVENSARDQG